MFSIILHHFRQMLSLNQFVFFLKLVEVRVLWKILQIISYLNVNFGNSIPFLSKPALRKFVKVNLCGILSNICTKCLTSDSTSFVRSTDVPTAQLTGNQHFELFAYAQNRLHLLWLVIFRERGAAKKSKGQKIPTTLYWLTTFIVETHL